MLTRRQAEALAEFIHLLRPDWDTPGIMTALAKAKEMGSAEDVAHAAIAATQRADQNTPAIIAMPGQHWRHTYVKQRSANTTPPRSRTCGICYLDRDQCEARWAEDHDFEPVGRRREVVLDEDLLAGLRRELFAKRLCRHKIDLNVGRCYECMGTVPQRPLLPPVKGGRPVEDVELP